LVDIKNITFGRPNEIKPEYKLFGVPVTLSVSYFSNNDFMTFLHNIETKINQELPVMWRISAVNYDIVKYLEPQEVNLSMTLYYINVPKQDLLAQSGTGDDALVAEIGTGSEHTIAE